jgi:hypothetical protein
MLRKPESRGLRRVLITVPVAGVAFAAANLGSVAFATIVPTTTTLTAPATAAQGASVTLTATVTPTGLFAGTATDQGSVAFKSGSTVLGSKTLSGCSAGQPCSASLATTALPVGTDSLTAIYTPSGGLTAGSSSTARTIVVEPTATSTSACTEGTDCNGGTVYATNLSSSINVQTHGGTTGGGTYTIQESTGGPALLCQDSGINADTGNYLVSTNDVTETVTYTLLGQAADQFNSLHPGTTPAICYGSPAQFPGSVFNSANNEYEGTTPACNATQSNAPCGLSQTYAIGNGPGGVNTETLVLVASAATTAGGNGNGNPCSHHQGQPQNCNTADPKVGP